MSRSLRFLSASVLACLIAAAPIPAAAADLSAAPPASLWSAAWDWLVDLVLPEGTDGTDEPVDSGPSCDAGGGIDPNGQQAGTLSSGSSIVREARPER